METEVQSDRVVIPRAWLNQQLRGWEGSSTPSLAIVVGEPGIGKTTWLRQWATSENRERTLYVDVRPTLGTDLSQGLNALLESVDLDSIDYILLDSFELGRGLWDSRGCVMVESLLGSGKKVLVGCRPGPHISVLRRLGGQLHWLSSQDPRNHGDVEAYVNLCLENSSSFQMMDRNRLIKYSEGNLLVASILCDVAMRSQNPRQFELNLENLLPLNEVLWGFWQEVVSSAPRDFQEPLSAIVALLSEVGEPLSVESISDFLGLNQYRVVELVDHLRPLLRQTTTGYTLFTGAFSRCIARNFKRDLVVVHARILNYFRDTYSSWSDMDDRYGWEYLPYHCERLARAGRKQDYDALHWLVEGSFIKEKFKKTGSLRMVLEDLFRGLRAALEEQDIPMIVGYSMDIARRWNGEAARMTHKQADCGKFELALDTAGLIRQGLERFLAYLNLGWLAYEKGSFERCRFCLLEALRMPCIEPPAEIYGYLAALVAHLGQDVELRELVFELIDFDDSPVASCDCYLHVVSLPIEESLREMALERACRSCERITEENMQNLRWKKIVFWAKNLGLEEKFVELEERVGAEAPSALEEAVLTIENFEVEARVLVAQVFDSSPIPIGKARALGNLWTVLLRHHTSEPKLGETFLEVIRLVDALGDERAKVLLLNFLLDSVVEYRAVLLDEIYLDRLEKVSSSLKQSFAKAKVYSHLAWIWQLGGNGELADRMVSRAVVSAAQLSDLFSRFKAYVWIAGMVAKSGHSERAQDLLFCGVEFLSETNSQLSLSTHEMVLECLRSLEGRGGDSTGQKLMLDEFERRVGGSSESLAGYHLESFLGVAEKLRRSGDTDLAQLLQKRMVSHARGMGYHPDQLMALSGVAEIFWKKGDLEQTRQTYEECQIVYLHGRKNWSNRDFVRVFSTYFILAHVVGGQEDVRSLEEDLVERLKKLEAKDFDRSCAQSLAKVHHYEGIRGGIREFIERMKLEVESLSHKERDGFYLSLVNYYLGCQKLEKASEAADQLYFLTSMSHAKNEFAVFFINREPQKSIQLLLSIPLHDIRHLGIRRCLVEADDEVRPFRVHESSMVLKELTLMAVEDLCSVDFATTLWVWRTSDPIVLREVAKKMGWNPDGLLQANKQLASEVKEELAKEQGLPAKGERQIIHQQVDREVETESPSSKKEQEEGFQEVSLTQMVTNKTDEEGIESEQKV